MALTSGMIAGIVIGAVVGGGTVAAKGGDVGDIFQGMFKGGVTGAIGSGFTTAAGGAISGAGGGAAPSSVGGGVNVMGGESAGQFASTGSGAGYGATSTGAWSPSAWNLSTEGGFTPAANTSTGAFNASNYSMTPAVGGGTSAFNWGQIGKLAVAAAGELMDGGGSAPPPQVAETYSGPSTIPEAEPIRVLAETTPTAEPEPLPPLGVPVSAQPGVFGPRELSTAEVVALNSAREEREAAQRKQETEAELGGVRLLADRDVAINPTARRQKPRTALERLMGTPTSPGAPYSVYA